jgi:DNA-directed RNA polymerase subunit RPC12/RpoP
MLCIRCSTDTKLSERKDGRCPSCGGAFAFEPRQGDPLSDRQMQRAIEVVSSEGEVWWNEDHLYFELGRRLLAPARRRARWVAGASLLGAAFATAMGGWFVAWIPALVGLWNLPRGWARVEDVLPRARFDALFGRWTDAHGRPSKLIVRRPLPPPDAQRALDPDIASYSFDRAVICDRPRTVDVLLANQFHFENNCAVLGVGGYPQATFALVRSMLKQNPRLRVYVLHEASPAGCATAARVANDGEWFGGRVRVVDVGLSPRQAMAMPRALWTRGPATTVRLDAHGFTEAERRWLEAGWSVELAVIRPEQIVKRLFRAIAEERELDQRGGGDGGGGGAGDDGVGLWVQDRHALVTETQVVDGGGDSFG